MTVLKNSCLDAAKRDLLKLIGATEKEYNIDMSSQDKNESFAVYQVKQWSEQETIDALIGLANDFKSGDLRKGAKDIYKELLSCNSVKNWDAGI